MNTKQNFFKKAFMFSAAFIMATTGCSSDPNISILPSTDNFTPSGTQVAAKMDILWVIDNSGSMQPYQDELQAQFNAFITEFVGNDFDFRMAVTTTDANNTFNPVLIDDQGNPEDNILTLIESELPSGFNGDSTFDNSCGTQLLTSNFRDGNELAGASEFPLISSTDPLIDFSLTPPESDPDSSDDIESIFNLNIAQGVCGSGAEAGLESMAAALRNPNNQSLQFPRSDAHLAVIIITDEEDSRAIEVSGAAQSRINNVPISIYDNFLKGISSQSLGYSFHTIGVLQGQIGDDITDPATGEPRKECLTDGVFNGQNLHPVASTALRYTELSNLSGGTVSSVCSSFADTLQNIARTIIRVTTEFNLTGVPDDPNSLIVKVRNLGDSDFSTIPQDSTNGWTYNTANNSIIFNGTAIPSQGAEIQVTFDPNSL